MKKYSKILVVLVLTVCMLVNSSSVFAFQTSMSEEPMLKVNLTTLVQWQSSPDDNNYMRQWLQKNKNIDLSYTYVETTANKIDDRMNMMLASHDVPDITVITTGNSTVGIANKWADAGLIVPVDEYLKKYPNIGKYFDKSYNKNLYANKKDGKMYMIPGNPAGNAAVIDLNVGPFIREDWLKKIGKSAPKTTDELYTVLKLFKEKIGKVGGKDIIPATFNNFRQYLGYTFTGNYYKIYSNNSKIEFYWNMPEIADYTTYMNKLYREKLLDPEVITQKDEMYQAKLNSGRVGFSIGVTPWMDNANNILKAKDKNARFIPCPVISVKGKSAPVLQATSPNQFVGILISKKFASNKDNLNRFMEYLNWNATPEGAFTLARGPIGVYTHQDYSGTWAYNSDVRKEIDSPNSTFKTKTGIDYYNLLYYPTLPLKVDKGFTPEVKMAQTTWKAGLQPGNAYFDMCEWGPIFNAKWGALWGEWPKWEAKAIYAKTEAESKKISKDMINYFNKNGGADIGKEKLKSYTNLLKSMGLK